MRQIDIVTHNYPRIPQSYFIILWISLALDHIDDVSSSYKILSNIVQNMIFQNLYNEIQEEEFRLSQKRSRHHKPSTINETKLTTVFKKTCT